MTYEYECKDHGKVDIYKSSTLIDREELCEKCQKPMKRNFVPTSNLNPGAASMRGEFNFGLGKHFNNRREVKNELKRIEGETGKKYVEVGSDKPQNTKRVRKEYNVEEAARHLKHELKHGRSSIH